MEPLSRRGFLALAAAAAAGLRVPAISGGEERDGALAEAIARLEYLTPPDGFGTVERGDPLPYTLPEEKRREVGLERESWRLEVMADRESGTKLGRPLTRELGTALDWRGLMDLASRHAVRYLKIMTCNNGGEPLGMGLWEGIPLREVVWMTKPEENVRRVYYHGYHNEDPRQLFQSSLPIGRVLEDPPGDPPVILCYKLNGEWLSGKRGGPVRMLVPEAYGFKSVKWLTRVVLTNQPAANDTYASGNNDIDSPLKTFARFEGLPEKAAAGRPIPVTGRAQVGISGLARVQVWIHPQDSSWPADDPFFTRAAWRDAEVLPPPRSWGKFLAGGRLPDLPREFEASTGQPREWPLRYTLAHWAALLPPESRGKYLVACRTIDSRGIAQPMPRPFPKSGQNAIQRMELTVDG